MVVNVISVVVVVVVVAVVVVVVVATAAKGSLYTYIHTFEQFLIIAGGGTRRLYILVHDFITLASLQNNRVQFCDSSFIWDIF